jgi:uncharacterized protein YlbG (UPF0298 family)
MKSLFCLMAIFLVVLFSCDSRKVKDDKQISLIGKWHRFSRSNGYTEFDIDSQYVNFFNQKVGRFKLPYKIENDSFKYLTSQYAAKVTDFGDSILLKGNDSTTATLHRFKEPNIPFQNIPDEVDSLSFAAYLNGFDKRLVREFEKIGITFFDDKGSSDTTYQQLLKMKQR